MAGDWELGEARKFAYFFLELSVIDRNKNQDGRNCFIQDVLYSNPNFALPPRPNLCGDCYNLLPSEPEDYLFSSLPASPAPFTSPAISTEVVLEREESNCRGREPAGHWISDEPFVGAVGIDGGEVEGSAVSQI